MDISPSDRAETTRAKVDVRQTQQANAHVICDSSVTT